MSLSQHFSASTAGHQMSEPQSLSDLVGALYGEGRELSAHRAGADAAIIKRGMSILALARDYVAQLAGEDAAAGIPVAMVSVRQAHRRYSDAMSEAINALAQMENAVAAARSQIEEATARSKAGAR